MSPPNTCTDRGLRSLLIELDPHRRAALETCLVSTGSRVEHAFTPLRLLQRITERPSPHVLLLGDDVQGVSALTLCRLIRHRSELPIIVIAPGDCRSNTCVQLLDAGADDYVPVTIEASELMARIMAVFRRCAMSIQDELSLRTVIVGPMRIDTVARTVTVDGVLKPLTRKEFDILRMLCSQPGSTFRRGQITGRVWRRDSLGLDHTLDSHITSLRSKLGARALIKTVRGVGYRVEATDSLPLRAADQVDRPAHSPPGPTC